MILGFSIWIAPEGEINNGTRIKPKLFSGCARIAVNYATESGLPVQLVPTLIQYEREQSFGTDVIISFGEPIVVSAQQSDPSRRIVREVMATLDKKLRRFGSIFACCPLHYEVAQGSCRRFIPDSNCGSRLSIVSSTLLDLWRMKLVDIGLQESLDLTSWVARLEYLQRDHWADISVEAWTDAMEQFFACFGAFIDALNSVKGGVVEEASTAFEVGQHIKLFPKLRRHTTVKDLEKPSLADAPQCLRSVKLLNVSVRNWHEAIRNCKSRTLRNQAEAALAKLRHCCESFVKPYVSSESDILQ